jgi:hypothetical protein
VSEWRPPSPLEPAGALFYLSVLVVGGVIAFRLRVDRGRPAARYVGPIVTVIVFGILAAFTGRGLAWWALAAPVAMVALQPGLRLADAAAVGLPRVRARTAREAAASENRASPLNAVVMVVLVVAGVALLPLWRPLGPAGVPVATLSSAPQGLAAKLNELIDRGTVDQGAHVWNPQGWGSWLEFAVPRLAYTVDSRIELFPAELWTDAHTVNNAQGEWMSAFDSYPVDVVLVEWDQAELHDALRQSGAWLMCAAREQEGWLFIRAPNDLPGIPGCEL